MDRQQAEQALESAEWDRDRALEKVDKAERELDLAESELASAERKVDEAFRSLEVLEGDAIDAAQARVELLTPEE